MVAHLAEARRPSAAYRRVVVPLTAEVESERAMALAAELAAEHGARIAAVVVIEVPPHLPLDAHMVEEEADARRVLDEARAIAESRGVRLRACILRARSAGEAIVAQAAEEHADVVVLRAPRAGAGRRIFGKTVTHVLKHAPCRVMVAAQPSSGCATPTPTDPT